MSSLLEEELANRSRKKPDENRGTKTNSRGQKGNKKNYDKTRVMERLYTEGNLVAIKRTQFGKRLPSSLICPYDVKKAAFVEGPALTSTSVNNMKLWKYVVENEDAASSVSESEYKDIRVEH